MKLSIVIPVYHEEDNILNVLRRIKAKVKTESEILIIYDYSKDPTIGVVKEYLKKNKFFYRKISLIKNNKGNGRGVVNAIKTGFEKAKGKAVIVVMGDLSDEIGVIDKMYKRIEEGYDLVCGSRYMKGGRRIGGSIIKGLMSRFAGLSLHYLFKLPTTDGTNAFKMYKKRVLQSIDIESKGGFEYSLEIVIKAFKKGYKIMDVPASWEDRVGGKSKFQIIKWLPHYLKWYFYVLKS